MRLLSLIATMVATAAIAIYAMTCSVNNVPPAPVHPIVGKWQQVVLCGRQVKPGAGMIVEIQSNKEIVYSMRDRAGNWSHEHGTYDIVGTAMYVCMYTISAEQM